MFVLDVQSVLAALGLVLLRLGVPLVGMWLVGKVLRRAIPSLF